MGVEDQLVFALLLVKNAWTRGVQVSGAEEPVVGRKPSIPCESRPRPPFSST